MATHKAGKTNQVLSRQLSIVENEIEKALKLCKTRKRDIYALVTIVLPSKFTMSETFRRHNVNPAVTTVAVDRGDMTTRS